MINESVSLVDDASLAAEINNLRSTYAQIENTIFSLHEYCETFKLENDDLKQKLAKSKADDVLY